MSGSGRPASGSPSLPRKRKTSSNAPPTFVSRSWIRSRNGGSSPSSIIRLRACRAVHLPSGFEVQATYSIRRVASEMKTARQRGRGLLA